MKFPSYLKKSIYSGLTFFLTILILSIWYGALNGGLTSSDKVVAGSGLTANSWNKVIDGIVDLDTRTAPISSSAGNVGIGVATPQAKLDVSGQIKISDGNAGVGKVLTSDATGVGSWSPVASTQQISNTLLVEYTSAPALYTAYSTLTKGIYSARLYACSLSLASGAYYQYKAESNAGTMWSEYINILPAELTAFSQLSFIFIVTSDTANVRFKIWWGGDAGNASAIYTHPSWACTQFSYYKIWL